LKSTVLCVCDSRLVLEWMQEALQEVHSVLTATSLSQAIAVASVEPLDLVLIAASEENTASYASTIKFVQPTCAILALTLSYALANIYLSAWTP
jgi:response regulator RpfG family c-di-GMP phosphodiesterase